MADEQKGAPQENGKSCCEGKCNCGCCCGSRKRCGCKVLVALVLIAIGYGLFRAGKCCGMHCAMPVAPAAVVAAPAVPPAQK